MRGGTALTDPRRLGPLPRACQKAAEGSLHKFSVFREHLTAALAVGLHAALCPHQFAGLLRATLTAFWTLSRPGRP